MGLLSAPISTFTNVLYVMSGVHQKMTQMTTSPNHLTVLLLQLVQ